MAHTIESRANSPANALRDALDKAERLIVTVDADTVEELLVLFDTIEGSMVTLSQGAIDLRPEQTRWISLQNRIYSTPTPITRAAAKAGGLASLRAKHPPAEGDWWRLDGIVLERRRKSALRTLSTVLIVVGALGLVYWAVNTLFPPDPDAVLMVETTSDLDIFVREQQWDGALALVDARLEQLPDEPELWIWKAVLHEQLGQDEAAAEAAAEAKLLVPDNVGQFWVVLGNTRFQVGDLAGAEAAANEAIALDSEDPQGYFLMGGVAEAKGDIQTAMDMFDKTYELAEFSNPELAVIARVRLGQMLQQPSFPNQAATDTPGPTPTPDPTPTP